MKKFIVNPLYEEIISEAQEAGNKAAKCWFDSSTQTRPATALLGDCGLAFIKIKDRRVSFAKYYIKREMYNTEQQMDYIYIPHDHSGRLEIGPKDAAMRAAMNVFSKYHVEKGLEVKVFID